MFFLPSFRLRRGTCLGWILAALLWAGTAELPAATVAPVDPRTLIDPALPAWITTPVPLPVPTDAPVAPVETATRTLVWEQQVQIPRTEQFYHYAVRIETEAGLQQFGQIAVGFAPSYEQLRWHYLRIWRGGVKRELLTAEALQVMRREEDAEQFMYYGRLTAEVILHDLRVGDVVEYAFTRSGENPVFAGRFSATFYGASTVPIDRLYYRVLTAPNRPLHSVTLGDFKLAPHSGVADGLAELSWTGTNLKAVQPLSDAPGWDVQFPLVQVSEFASWAEVADWGGPLFALPAEPSPELRERVRTLTAAWPTTEEKANALLRFVQDEVRYLGIELGESSHRPSSPDEVLSRRFGDCKDKSLLLVALLRSLGVKAEVALVQTRYTKRVIDFQPSPQAFNHAIVHVTLDPPATAPKDFASWSAADAGPAAAPRDLWLDPTIASQGGTWRHHAVGNYSYALLLAPGTDRLWPMDAVKQSRDEVAVVESFHISDYHAPVRLSIAASYSGNWADYYRHYSRSQDPRYFTQQLSGWLARFYPKIKNVHLVEWSDRRDENEVQATATFEVAEFWKAAAGSNLLSAQVYPWSLTEHLPRPETTEREHAFALPYPFTTRHRIDLELPDNWPLKPESMAIHDPTFDYEFSMHSGPRRVSLDYSWTSRRNAVLAAEMPNWSKTMSEVRGSLGYHLSQNLRLTQELRRKGIVWPVVAASLGGCLSGLMLGLYLFRYRPKSADLPLTECGSLTGLGGWLILVGIGTVLRPVWYLETLAPTWAEFANWPWWVRFTDPESNQFVAGFAPLLLSEKFFNFLIVGWSLVLIVQFFHRKASFPLSFILLMLAGVAVALGHYLLAHALLAQSTANLNACFKLSIYAAIWVAYTLRSRRVQLTFRN